MTGKPKLTRLYDSNEITDTEYKIRANQNKMHRKNTIAITVTKGKINSILFADCKLFVGLGKYLEPMRFAMPSQLVGP
jgi:hypothetical protein